LAGLKAGADILNDIHGLNRDQRLVSLLPRFHGLILMAYPTTNNLKGTPIMCVRKILQRRLVTAKNHIDPQRIAIDPGIGFFRNQRGPWWKWDISILNHLTALKSLKRPLLVGVSRKSFIGHLLGGKPAEERLAGSLAATAVAIRNGAKIIRTHDIAPTKDLVRILERLI
jgi:dihydropteroate synthase